MGDETTRDDRVQDGRERHWFYIDNAIIDDYAPKIGGAGVMVYMALVRHANGGGRSYPSLRRLAQLLGLSRPTILKALGILQQYALITLEHRASDEGDATSNLYTILPVGGGQNSLPPSKESLPQVVKNIDQGGQNSLPEVLKSFKDLRDLKDYREATPSKRRPPAPVLEQISPAMTRKKTYFPEDPAAQERLRLQVLTPALQAWATAKGLTLDLAEEWEHFRGKAIANAYRYSDWSQAYRNWLTNDFQRPRSPARKTNAQRAQELEAWAQQQQKEM